MRRVAALVCAGAAALALPTMLSATLSATSAGATAAAAQAEIGVRIELTGMSPRLVTTDGPAVLTVTGRVINSGNRTVQDVDVRVQRGQPIATEGDLRAALAGDIDMEAVRPRFTRLPQPLPPGAEQPFLVQVPLRGNIPLESLQIDEPGVYPLLVNLNGQPDFGGRARLAAARLLLPVIGVPGAPAPSPPSVPAPLTMLWPLVDRPQRLPTVDNTPVVLRDEQLATSLADGGRLSTLLRAAATYAPPGSPLASALCLAVDPDLVETVRLMAEVGYQLPDGTAGKGSPAAAAWLRSLRELVSSGRCVLALPYADVDLVALSRAGLTDLQGRARTDGAQILRDVLGVRPFTGLTWPDGELLDERTLTDLASLGDTTVLLRPAGLADPTGAGQHAVVGLATGAPATAAVRGMLVDSLVSAALAGPAPVSTPRPAQLGTVQSTTPAGTDGPLSAQDGLATLAYEIRTSANGGVLLTPPRRWANADEATELLATAARLLADRLAQSRDLGTLTAVPPRLTATLNYPSAAAAAEIPRSVTAAVTTIRDQLRDLSAATERDPRAPYDPARLLDPERFALLRGTSTAWRGQEQTAATIVQQADDRLTELRENVQIVPPAGPYLLAASNSPLLLNLDNPLPVQINVQITLSTVPGLRTNPVDVITMPAASRRQVRVPAEVIRAGQFSVEAKLTTPGGTPLGPRDGAPSRIQLRSTAYGTVTLLLTGGAGALLVLAAAFRITRRVRAGRASGAQPGAPSAIQEQP